MCGLAGFAGSGDAADMARMTDALAHRGPDGRGLFHDPDNGVHLGHRRLSIIDIDGGRQPMASADGAVVVVYNGEIYNHRDLRRDLEAAGHIFVSDHSDTEVLIHGWRQWGAALPEHLNGMFAFAIWDRAAGTIFLARDRFGEKPLYWARTGDCFLFASELSALTGHAAFTPEIDRAAQRKLLAYGFIPAPLSYWRDTAKLPAGCWLRYQVGDGRIDQGCYYRFAIEPGDDVSLKRAADEVRGLLMQSVERRLMADVPLGVFLSGGIDSSAVAACAAAHRPIETFAVGFTEPSFDESGFARIMANHLGSLHREEILDLDGARQLIPEILAHLDEPMGDASLLPTSLLCRFAARHVKVALSGDGGDELFAGYDTFAALPIARLYRTLMRGGLHKGVCRLADLLPKSGRNMSLDFKLRRALGGMGHGAELWHPLWLSPLSPEGLEELLNEPVRVDELYSEALDTWHGSGSSSLVDRGLEFYTRHYLQDGILTKVDRAAMAHGLETRAVFLDVDLVEYVRRLPAHLKIGGGIRKRVLKKAVEGLLPAGIIARKKKGFGIPLLAWLKESPFPAPTGTPAADEIARRWHRQHRAGEADHRLFLWCWTVLHHHHQRWGL